MEYGYAILMFAFAVLMWIYALCLRSGDYGLVLRGHATSPKDKKAYARYVGKLVALVAIAPFLSALVSLIGPFNIMILVAVAVLIIGIVAFLIIGIKCFDDGQNDEE